VTAALVSVVIPAFNASATLAECLASVLAQGYPSLDVVVVDDGSTDGTADVVAHYGARVRYVRQENGGLAAARNTGHQEARGEFVAWLDADDICLPDRIGLQAAFLNAHPSVGLVCSEFSAFGTSGLMDERYGRTYYGALATSTTAELFGAPYWFIPDNAHLLQPGRAVPCHRANVYHHMVWGNFVHPPTVMLRRSLLTQSGPLDPSFRLACDWEFFIRASRVAEVGYLDLPLLLYRIHAAQMSSGARAAHIHQWIAVRDKTFAADPHLASTAGSRARKQLGSWHSWLARHAAEDDRMLALKHLLVAARHGMESRVAMAALAMSVLPRSAIPMLRVLRHVARF